jgi:hypothetical protein
MDIETREAIDSYARDSLRAAIAIVEQYRGEGRLDRFREHLDRREDLMERVRSLEAALRDYGDHRSTCRHLASSPANLYACNCGFFDALEAAGVVAR